MTAETLGGRFQLAAVRDGRPAWAAAEVVIATPPVELGDVPTIGALFVQLVTAPGAPSFDRVLAAAMDRDRRRVTFTVEGREPFFTWAAFLGLHGRSEVLERGVGQLHLLRTGHVTVAGVRLAAVVRWRLDLVEVGA